MLIAEDLLLLHLDDSSGRPVTDSARLDNALGGALLIELSLQGRIDVAGPGEQVRKGRLVVRDRTPLGNAVLDQALNLVDAKEGTKPGNVLGKLTKGLRQRLLDNLAAQGVLREEKAKVLGIFPTTRWPASDSSHEDALRARLSGVLVQGLTPDSHTGAIISMLSAIDTAPKVVGAQDKRAVKRRAKEIAQGDWAADAVKKAVEAVNAGVMASVTAATAAAASGSS